MDHSRSGYTFLAVDSEWRWTAGPLGVRIRLVLRRIASQDERLDHSGFAGYAVAWAQECVARHARVGTRNTGRRTGMGLRSWTEVPWEVNRRTYDGRRGGTTAGEEPGRSQAPTSGDWGEEDGENGWSHSTPAKRQPNRLTIIGWVKWAATEAVTSGFPNGKGARRIRPCDRLDAARQLIRRGAGAPRALSALLIMNFCQHIDAIISVARIPGRGGTGAEPGGEKGWAIAEYICGTDSWSGRDWCGAGRVEALSVRGVYLWHGFTFLSSRFRQIYRKQESRGKSVSQLTTSRQRKFERKRRALESHARTGSCQMNSGKQPRKETPVVSPTRRISFWSARAKPHRKEWKAEPTSTIPKGFRKPADTRSAGGHFCSPAKRIFNYFVQPRIPGSGRDGILPSRRGKPATLSLSPL